jgi:hypothetical protein
MKAELINEQDAPAKPKQMSKNAKASFAILQALKPGKVQKITPEKGETLRGVKLSLSRVASLNKLKVEVYDDGTNVFVKLA